MFCSCNQHESTKPHRLIACHQLGAEQKPPKPQKPSLAAAELNKPAGWAIRAAFVIPNVCDDSHAEMQRGRVRHWRSLLGDVCCCWHEAGLSRPLPWSARLQGPCGQSVQVGANGAPTTPPTEPPTHLAPACWVCPPAAAVLLTSTAPCLLLMCRLAAPGPPSRHHHAFQVRLEAPACRAKPAVLPVRVARMRVACMGVCLHLTHFFVCVCRLLLPLQPLPQAVRISCSARTLHWTA